MHAERELRRLAEVKFALRRRIARRRGETASQVACVARPLQWADRLRLYWQQTGPLTKLASGPLGAWLLGRLFRRRKMIGSLMRWGPSIWGFARLFMHPGAGRTAT